MITGTTSSGFKFSLAETAVDNMELLDALADASDNDPLAISRVLTLLLGKEQKQKMYDALREEDGRVPIAKVNEEIVEIFRAFGKSGKN